MTEPRPGLELAEAFAPFDRNRLENTDPAARAGQLAARQLFYDYIDELWKDVERAGERPAVGEKYQAITNLRDLAQALRSTAFEAVYGNPGEAPGQSR
ncbi:MAG TPA: hypothetical protein VH008_11540 [Pseudonocardia sp.]|nr:hypothetical protein [Pseudonocardia sp.]